MEIVEENQGKSHWEKHEETHQLQMHESSSYRILKNENFSYHFCSAGVHSISSF